MTTKSPKVKWSLPRKKQVAPTTADYVFPTRKMSETILDFGQTVLLFDGTPEQLGKMRSALELVITIWNANVMTSQIWGRPDMLPALRTEMVQAGPAMVAELDRLCALWKTKFSHDLRAVGEWSFGPDGRGGYSFKCDIRFPTPAPKQARSCDEVIRGDAFAEDSSEPLTP